MLRKSLAIAALYLKMTFRSRGILATQLLMPLVFTFVIGQATGSFGGSGPRSWAVAVVNLDEGPLGAALVERLQAEPTLALQTAVTDDSVASLTIPADFSARLLEGQSVGVTLELLSDNAIEGQLVEQMVLAAAAQVRGSLVAGRAAENVYAQLGFFEAGLDREAFAAEALAQAQAVWQAPPLRLQAEQESELETAAGQIPQGVSQSSPGMVVMFAMFLMLGGSAVLIQERQQGTLRRLLVTPIDKSTLMAGKMLGIYATGIVQMTLLILFGALALGVAWGQAPLALALVVLAYGLAITSLGIMIAALARTYDQAGALGTLITLSFASLGGAWWPLDIVPPALQSVGRLTPVSWAMDGFHDVITRGLGVTAVLPEVGMLLLFAAVFLAVGLSRFRYE
jgi:ABC-2 type transport system permease protein